MARSDSFVHLHVHSEHSALDSTARVADLVAAAAADGQEAIAITDHGSLAGIYAGMVEAKKAGIKLIAGEEVYLAIGSRHEQNTLEVVEDGRTKTKRYHHLTVLATGEQGWANLAAMHNQAQNSRWGKHARIDYELLAEHAEGLIVLTGCLGGPVLGPLSRGDEQAAREGIEALTAAVGHENVYVEVMDHGIGAETAVLPRLVELAGEYDLPLVATNDAHHVTPDGGRAHEAWLALQTGKRLTDPPADRFTFTGSGYHLRTGEEMYALRDETWWHRACLGTTRLAERCEETILPEHYLRLPKFPVPEGFKNSRAYFVHLVKAGAKRLYGDPYPRQVAERLNTELKVISSFGVIDYFLILHELITWARSQGIRVGPGRGSAAGACVAHCLGITQVDPLRFDLLFERFLDPSRIGMPDIDVDFEKNRRDEVLAHLVDMYGEDYVARIGTFQVSKSKASIKHAVRVLGLPAKLGDRLSKQVPMDGARPYTLAEMDATAEEDAAGFWDEVASTEAGDEVIDLARQFEEVTTGTSIHACGTVVSDAPLHDLIPMRKDTGKGSTDEDPLVTEWDADGVDKGVGLLKLDVLGLKNLDVISSAVANIKALTGEEIDPDHLPDGDDLDNNRVLATWRLLARGHTAGVFQLDGSGLTELTQDVNPTNLEHLSALVALYRPGPMAAEMHTRYAARKNGREEVDYSIFTTDPDEQAAIASVLDSTYGLTVYQEQAMLLGDVVAGFDAATRNRLRKGVSKKIAHEVEAVGELFLAGAESETTMDGRPKLAFSPETAQRVWDSIRGGAAYMFNHSHSAAYGYLAYVTAFLKANWPSAYAAATLEHTEEDDKRALVLNSLDAEGVRVLPPQVNTSQQATTASDQATVVLGLGEVKDVGKAAMAIVAEREAGGVFTSMADLLARVRLPGEGDKPARLTTKTAQALIECGAADEFGPRKGQIRTLWSMRSGADVPVPDEEWGVVERSVRQHSRLGLVLGQHPMSALTGQVKHWRPPIRDEEGNALVRRPKPLHKVLDSGRETVTTVGLVTAWKVSPDNRGGQRARMRLEGSHGAFEAMVWNNTLQALKTKGHHVGVGSVVGVQARVRTREIEQTDEDGTPRTVELHSLTVRKLWPIDYEDTGARHAPAPHPVELANLVHTPGSVPPASSGSSGAKTTAEPAPSEGDGEVTSGQLVAAPTPLRRSSQDAWFEVIRGLGMSSLPDPNKPGRLVTLPNEVYDQVMDAPDGFALYRVAASTIGGADTVHFFAPAAASATSADFRRVADEALASEDHWVAGNGWARWSPPGGVDEHLGQATEAQAA